MNLLPHETAIVRHLLTGHGEPPSLADLSEFQERLDAEAPALGEHVCRLVCLIGTDARKLLAQNSSERRALRETLGRKALPKGVGPAKPRLLFAPTMNEYVSLAPWQKEDLRKLYDEEIERLKAQWPRWSCGVVRRTVQGKGGVERVVQEGGRRRAIILTRESSVRPDDPSAGDAVGLKIPADRLVTAGVLRGDTSEWLVRHCLWKPAKRGEGRVVVDVYEVVP